LEMPSKLPLRPQTPALHYAEIHNAAQQSRKPEQQEIVQRPIQTTAQHLPLPQELGPRRAAFCLNACALFNQKGTLVS
jgi:hypothetical protein